MHHDRSLRLYDPLPGFRLLDPTGQVVDTDDYRSLPGLLIAFVDCSSAPSRRLHAPLGKLAWEYGRRGAGVLLVNPAVARGRSRRAQPPWPPSSRGQASWFRI
ncbi:MAG TPA: hypothetical protein VMT16_15480 [Thermoanaerobaculia bacterium]|nr:hypothetical protein [Thermoanaerobaculia bacterium]